MHPGWFSRRAAGFRLACRDGSLDNARRFAPGWDGWGRGDNIAMHALSLKQPWATLLVHGLKTIEVRRWPTARRGPVLIHAARIPDERPEAWGCVPLELQAAARRVGGIIGAGRLTSCIPYRTVEAFTVDYRRHLNEASWFRGPVLYGFSFTDLSVRPFRPFPGWMRFFPVPDEDAPPSGASLFS
jgi:hypothetical protein